MKEGEKIRTSIEKGADHSGGYPSNDPGRSGSQARQRCPQQKVVSPRFRLAGLLRRRAECCIVLLRPAEHLPVQGDCSSHSSLHQPTGPSGQAVKAGGKALEGRPIQSC